MKLEQFLDNPAWVKKMKFLFYVVLVVLVGVDATMHKEHVHFPFEALPGFSALYGLLSTVLIIVVAKGIGHAFLMKPENYYSRSKGEEGGGAHHD